MRTLMIVTALLTPFLLNNFPTVPVQDGKKAERTESKKARTRAKAGDDAPAFTAKGVDGKEVTLDSLRGERKDKIVVISFWSHACPWSRAWDPELSKIAKDYSSKNVVVIAIDSNKEGHSDGTNTDSVDDIKRYHKELSLNFNVLVDPTSSVADAFGGETTPDVFVIGTNGKVVYTGQVNDMSNPDAPDKFKKSYLRDAIDAALAGKEPETATTSPKGCGIKRAKRSK